MRVLLITNEKEVEVQIASPKKLTGEALAGKKYDIVIVDEGVVLVGEVQPYVEHTLVGKNYHRKAKLL